MKILPDGRVEIEKMIGGNPTGETKIITPDELPRYGIPYTKYLEQLKAYQTIQTGKTGTGTIDPMKVDTATDRAEPQFSADQSLKLMLQQALSKDIAAKGSGRETLSAVTKEYVPKCVSQENILSQYNTTSPWGPATETGEQLAGKGFGYDPDVIEKFRPGYKEQVKKTELAKMVNPQADRLVTELENYYFQNDLAMGNLGGVFADIGTKLDPNSPYAIYKNMLESKRPQLAKLAGDVGNIAVQEQIQAGKPFPTARSTKKMAIERFQQIRKNFGLPERNYNDLSKYSTIGLQDISKQFGGK
jgi:hypothetical protein